MSFLLVFATMLRSVCVTPFVRAETAQNAFVIVGGEGVVRLDGRNFAVMGGDANNETEVTITPQPGWTLMSPSRVKVKAGSPVPFQVRSKSMEEIVNGTMTLIQIELTAYGCCHYANGEEGAFDAAAEIPVPEDKEENPGAFIHWNIDNDNASAGGTAKHPGGDYLEHSTVLNENDLKKLGCALWSDTESEVDTGVAVLSLKSSTAAVWKSRQKGSAALVVSPGNEKRWNLSDASERADFYSVKDSLYVEGIASGSCDIEFRFELQGKSISDIVRYTFIAADCGRQPSVFERESLEGKDGVDVEGCEWSIVREADSTYNCYGFVAASGNNLFWIFKTCQDPTTGQPVPFPIYNSYENRFEYGVDCEGNRDGTFQQEDIQPFLEAMLSKKLEVVESVSDADIACYEQFHAAKRDPSCRCGAGLWEMFQSKLSYSPAIEHRVEALSRAYDGISLLFKILDE